LRAAIIEANPIDPERDAGARAITDLRDSFVRIGFETTLLVENPNLENTLANFNSDVIVVSRASTMIRAQHFRKEFNAPVLYWAHDLQAKRISLREGIEGTSASASLVISFIEQLAISSADLAVFPTKEDSNEARRKYCLSNIEQHQYFSFNSQPRASEPAREDNIVFIGSPEHAPNPDGLCWFLEDCWPWIHDKANSAKLKIIGAWQDSEISNEDHYGVEFTGPLSEVEVGNIMSESLIGVSPLRFGAGLKRKTLQYLDQGLALVSTDFGLQGLPRSQDHKSWIRANTSNDFVDAIIGLLSDRSLTNEISKSGNEFLRQSFPEQAFDSGLARILNKLQVLA
jgi:glycosyltransferase involved in cell wall biosynthesis